MTDQHDQHGDGDSGTERVITDAAHVQRWAERHDLVPVRRAGSGGTRGVDLRDRDRVGDSQDRLDWDSFRDTFESADLALVLSGDDDTRGTHRLLDRETARNGDPEALVDQSEVTDRPAQDRTATAVGHGETDTVDRGTPNEPPTADADRDSGIPRDDEKRRYPEPGSITESDRQSEPAAGETTHSQKPADAADSQTTDTDEHGSEREVTETAGEQRHAQTGDAGRGAAPDISKRLLGQDVETPSGGTVGIVADVDPERDRIYVEADPGLTDRLKATVGWGDDDTDTVVRVDQVEEFRRTAVVVEGDETDR